MQLYRLERYNECKTVYTDLIRNSQDEYEEERKTNLAAVVAAMSQWEKAPTVRSWIRTTSCFCLIRRFEPVLSPAGRPGAAGVHL